MRIDFRQNKRKKNSLSLSTFFLFKVFLFIRKLRFIRHVRGQKKFKQYFFSSRFLSLNNIEYQTNRLDQDNQFFMIRHSIIMIHIKIKKKLKTNELQRTFCPFIHRQIKKTKRSVHSDC